MDNIIMKGAPAAAELAAGLKKRSEELKALETVPCLALIRVGEEAADISYEKGLLKRAEEAGVTVKKYLFDASAGKEEILEAVRDINRDETIHGCLMFRPLKDRTAEMEVSELLDPKKDVDSMTLRSQARAYTDGSEGFYPCTAEAVMELLRYYHIDVSGKKAVVIGRSQVIGRPAAMLLLNSDATVTICHSKSRGLKDICRSADILVAAVGRAEMIDESYLAEGQIVLDVGINTNAEGRLCGDVKESAKQELASAYTPVPGGVGSVTTAILMKHVIEAAEKGRGIYNE